MIEIENNTKTGGIIFKLSHDKWMKYGSRYTEIWRDHYIYSFIQLIQQVEKYYNAHRKIIDIHSDYIKQILIKCK